MAFFGNAVALIQYDSGVSPATNQAPAARSFNSSDNSPEDQVFGAVYNLTQTGGATSPTASLVVYVSNDNTNWIPFQTLGTNGTTTSQQGTIAINGWRYMKADLTVGGGTAPAVIAQVYIGWSGQATAV